MTSTKPTTFGTPSKPVKLPHEFDILAELRTGRLLLNEREPDESGALHASSIPVLVGRVLYGSQKQCPRMAWLRWQGVDIPAEEERLLMFAAGHANEDSTAKELTASGRTFVRESDPGAAISWTHSGVRITGRPDFVNLVRGGKRAELGLELKLVSSIWTARNVHYELVPNSDHLIQAAHYSWQHGFLPWSLLYTNRVDFHLSTAPKWLKDKFTPDSPSIEWGDDGPFKIVPFERAYRLGWTENKDADQRQLMYWTEGMDEPQITAITPSGIKSGVFTIANLGSPGVGMGPRPSTKHVDGIGKTYKACDYCPLAEVCDQYEDTTLDVWADHARQLLAKIDEAG